MVAASSASSSLISTISPETGEMMFPTDLTDSITPMSSYFVFKLSIKCSNLLFQPHRQFREVQRRQCRRARPQRVAKCRLKRLRSRPWPTRGHLWKAGWAACASLTVVSRNWAPLDSKNWNFRQKFSLFRWFFCIKFSTWKIFRPTKLIFLSFC